MPRPLSLAAGLLILFLSSASSISAAGSATEFAFFHENVLGTSLELRVRAENRNAALAAEARVLREIDRLATIFSGYDPTSELSRWQDRRPASCKVSAELFEVLQACDAWIRRSGGAFDPRTEALTRLWSRCARLDRRPNELELAEARALMSASAWRLDVTTRTAERVSDCPLSLNGIAKGYIVGRACEVALEEREVKGVLLNVGGDLRVSGEISQTIGIAAPWADSESSDPLAFIEVKNRSVATSGRSQRGLKIGGKWYSHVFDPRTGEPVERVASATVVAPRAMDADALAKVCCVLEPEESLRLVHSLADTECLIVMATGELAKSNGWAALERTNLVAVASPDDPEPKSKPVTDQTQEKDAKKAKAKTTPSSPWNKDLELLINFEINNPMGADGNADGEERGGRRGRYRRPYLAVWIEDADGRAVRTLSLWVSSGGAGPFQWLPDLKRWFQADNERKLTEKKEILFTVSRPTRPPGKYKVIWDGKDNNGKQLPCGEYTVTVEAAREHGTYQSIRKQVALDGKPFTEELNGNVEIKSASIEYRRKPAAKK
jgi:thiamine biosynthesis lipoprotein ApbE